MKIILWINNKHRAFGRCVASLRGAREFIQFSKFKFVNEKWMIHENYFVD